MNDVSHIRLSCAALLFFLVIFGSGCGNHRQVVYPHSDGRVAKAKPRRDAHNQAPVVNVRIEDQDSTLPPILGD